MARFEICIVRPPRSVDSEAFREIAESLRYALSRLGHRATIAENRFSGQATSIVLGADLLRERALELIPAAAIVYNLEQIFAERARDNPGYIELLQRRRVWDYSMRNLSAYAALGANVEAELLPVGYVPELARIRLAPVQDIDVLFYGALNERRIAILEEIAGAGLATKVVTSVYGPARDELIGRAKLVLNLHFYPAMVFEIVRVSYLLANRKAVVSESSELDASEADLADALRFAPPEELADACVELAYDAARRSALEERGYARFSARRLEDRLGALVGRGVHASPGAELRYPLRLKIGRGTDRLEDALIVDARAQPGQDAVLDVGAPLALPLELHSARFGPLVLHENMFDEIVADDALGLQRDLPMAMTNFLRLLKPAGVLRLAAKADPSAGPLQDPARSRAFEERSWKIYTDSFGELGWSEHRFELVDLRYVLSTLGRGLQDDGSALEDILRRPGAVDETRVTLRKVFVTEQEADRAAATRDPPQRADAGFRGEA